MATKNQTSKAIDPTKRPATRGQVAMLARYGFRRAAHFSYEVASHLTAAIAANDWGKIL